MTAPGEPPQQAWSVCVSVLESVATALVDLAVSVRSAAEQIRGEPAAGEEHRCVMPRGAPVFSIYRCPSPCGKSWRLYPPSVERAAAQWREI